jgi:hypothetical protein
MGRIKIKDLRKDRKISKSEMKRIRGGALVGQLSTNLFKISYGPPVLSESQDDKHKD